MRQTSKRGIGHTAARVGAYAAAAYGIAIFVAWVLQFFLGEQIPTAGMIKGIIQLLLLPSLPLLLLSLLLGRGRLSLTLLPAAIIFIVSYGIFFWPRSLEPPGDASTLRVMTFNLQAPDADEMESLLAILREADADVVAVQELSFPAAERFAAQLTDRFPHQALHPQTYAHAGQGLLSRYPIVADEFWRYDQDRSALGHQRVALDIGGDEVVLYNTHPIPPYAPEPGFNAEKHTRALQDVLARANGEAAPTLILGDFNMTDQFSEYHNIRRTFTDAYRAVGAIGPGFTFPHGRWAGVPPLLRLDYIFYSAGWRGIAADVWPRSGSSDHAPLRALLVLN